MPRWGTWTTGWRRRRRWRRSATRRRAPSPPSSALPLASHMSHVPAAEGVRGETCLCVYCSTKYLVLVSSFWRICALYTYKNLHILFVCVRIYQDDFEKVSIKTLGLKKSSKTNILHSIEKKKIVKKKFHKTLAPISWNMTRHQQGKRTTNQLKWFMMNHYIYRRFFTREMIIIQPQQSSILKVKHHWHHFGTVQFGLKLSEPKMYHKIMTNIKANKITLCHFTCLVKRHQSS